MSFADSTKKVVIIRTWLTTKCYSLTKGWDNFLKKIGLTTHAVSPIFLLKNNCHCFTNRAVFSLPSTMRRKKYTPAGSLPTG